MLQVRVGVEMSEWGGEGYNQFSDVLFIHILDITFFTKVSLCSRAWTTLM
jgi:hypothetical protein